MPRKKLTDRDRKSTKKSPAGIALVAKNADVEINQPAGGTHVNLARRVEHELIAYLGVSGYLFVWFSALLFYKATILQSVGIAFAPFAFAAIKALILGKFILALEALKIGEHGKGGGVLIVEIAAKALFFTLLLTVLSIIEEVIVGHLHGREAKEVVAEMGGGTLQGAIATGVLVFLVLIPYLGFRRLALTYGELPELLFTRYSRGK